MSERSNEDIVRRYLAAHAAHDYDTVGAMRHAGWTMEWPQSRERVRGHANDRAIMDNWPGGLPTAGAFEVVGSEDRWVMTPSFTVQRIIGSGDAWWADGTADYPDGSTWLAAARFQLLDGTIFYERWLFAPPLEAPSWRSRWVEPIEGV